MYMYYINVLKFWKWLIVKWIINIKLWMEDNFEGINIFFIWKRFVWYEIEKKYLIDNVI